MLPNLLAAVSVIDDKLPCVAVSQINLPLHLHRGMYGTHHQTATIECNQPQLAVTSNLSHSLTLDSTLPSFGSLLCLLLESASFTTTAVP